MIERTNVLVFLRFWECLHDVMNPLEVAKISIFSENDYDFRNQRPENVLKLLKPLILEEIKCTIPNPYGHYDVMTPLEVAKILIFSQNHYDFWNQRQKISKKDVDRSPQQKSVHWSPLTKSMLSYNILINRKSVKMEIPPAQIEKIVFEG